MRLIVILLCLFHHLCSGHSSCSDEVCHCTPHEFPTTVSCISQSLLIIPNDLPPSTTKLTLNDNEIHSIDNILVHYSQLTHLSLRNNRITNIQSGSFRNSGRLVFLDLSSNRLNSLSRMQLHGLTQLTELSVANNLIERLQPKLFLSCPHLSTVDLSDNRLITLDSTVFVGVRSLQTINLAENDFKQIPAEAFKHAQHMSILSISENPLETLSYEDFSHLSRLSELYLSGCGLNNIRDNVLSQMTSLDTLDLSNNELSSMPTLSHLDSLRTLYIGLNRFQSVGDALSPLRNLRTFVLKGCHQNQELIIDKETFASNLKLEVINVTKCAGLKWIPGGTFAQLPYLRVLNLHGNALSTLDGTMADWQSVEVFELTGNPIHCNCSSAWLNSLYSSEKFESQSKPFCYSPSELQGQQLGEISPQDIPFCDGNKGGETENESKNMNLALILPLTIVSMFLIAAFVFFLWRWKNRKDLKKKEGKIYMKWPKLKKPKRPVSKAEIKVVPEQIHDSSRFIDVLPEKQLSEEEHETGHIYEELPLHNFPDVKVSVI